ncbi:MAG TPA: hypothetical protein VN887_14125 [Candidatus Angelobacter sp.]|nr:hypothetical protein [Candidatus Angelobacter sp.]
MNAGPAQSCCDKARVAAYSIGILGTFLLVALLVLAMRHYTQPAPVGAGRVAERHKFLRDLRDTEAKTLGEYDWQDKDKGIVRLPIRRALELVLQEWQNPAAARSNMIARVDKATAPPPKAPEKPNPYE